ncbi:MAG: C40 family peptidase [Methylomonas sp.]|jgi:cell wall-associated NlpC family hydrolase
MQYSRPFLRRLKQFSYLVFLALISGCATFNKPQVSQPATAFAPQENSKIVHEALQLQGQPYVSGGESPSEGFDCSGLVYYVYKKQGLSLPRDTWSQANRLPSVQLNQRQPGDLVFFTINTKPFSHVGIYVGNDKFVHAPSSRTGKVMMSDLNHPYWRERFTAVRRPPVHQPLSLNDSAPAICLLN